MKIVEKNDDLKSQQIPDGFHLIEGLPSGGKFYDEGTKIYSRPLKVLELKKLAAMTEDNFNQVIHDILQGSVWGIDVDDLVLIDKIFIILWQRANTFEDEKFDVSFICPDCKKESNYHFDLTCVSVDDVPEGAGKNAEYAIGDDKIVLDMLRVKDEAVLLERTADKNLDSDVVMMAMRIKKVNGKTLNFEQAYKFISEMNPANFMKLVKVMNETDVEVKPNISVVCKECGGRVEIPMSFRGNFFLPTYSG